MVARVGSDLFGPATIENFKKLGIDATHVKQVEGVSSGVAPIFVEPNGQNRILRGEGRERRVEAGRRRCRRRPAEGRRLHRAAVRDSARDRLLHRRFRAEERHSLHSESRARPADRFKALAGLDYFVPNESEAETITGMPVKNVEDAKKCAEKLLGYGIRRVIITLGANGSLLAGKEGMEHLPAFPVKSIDSTGAGDAFIGSFAVFLGEGLPEREAVRRANLYAGLSTTGVGTQKSFYDRARFDAEWAARSKS